MSDQLEKRGKALENEYFRKKEEELIAKMKEKSWLPTKMPRSWNFLAQNVMGTLLETDYEGHSY